MHTRADCIGTCTDEPVQSKDAERLQLAVQALREHCHLSAGCAVHVLRSATDKVYHLRAPTMHTLG